MAAAGQPAGHQVTLWARRAEQAQALATARENQRYLAGVQFPDALHVAEQPSDVRAAAAALDLVVVATPMAGLRESLMALRGTAAPVVWLCKGFEAVPDGAPADAHGLMGHEVQAQVAPDLRAGLLTGPSFALEVAQRKPAALVAASQDAAVRALMVQAFHGPSLRIYGNDDMVGAAVGGAVKNVLAIATGFCDGMALGMNARAALVTRGLAEMTRLGLALGAQAETFMGLSGMGDLVLTATGSLSRNRTVGVLLAEGKTLAQAVDSLGHVAEGVYSARTVVQRARLLGVDMPIAESVLALLEGQIGAADVVATLMGREPKVEQP